MEPFCSQAGPGAGFPPIYTLYNHLHDAIRGELQTLSNAVLHLEHSDNLVEQLWHLKDRYRFLGQIYKYHSSVEDEVVYPALDSKVKNVTLAYSVEHEDEEQLFVQLSSLLSKALQETGKQQATTVRQLACKVEEIHITLRKHLAKEEEQLLPLLLRHFSFGEQAELVAQFLCCIPLSTVQPVLAWLKSTMPPQHQAGLQWQVGQVVSDQPLQQLLVAWLCPRNGACLPGAPAPDSAGAAAAAAVAAAALQGRAHAEGGPGETATNGWADGAAGPDQQQQQQQQWALGALLHEPEACSGTCGRRVCCREAPGSFAKPGGEHAVSGGSCQQAQRDVEDSGGAGAGRPPLREIVYFHQAIRSALGSFAEETRALRDLQEGGVTPWQLQSLVERHRFIRAVCLFHSASEDEVVFPALRQLTAVAAAAGGGGGGQQPPQAQQAQQPQQEQQQEQMEVQQGGQEAQQPQGSSKHQGGRGASGGSSGSGGVRHRCEADHAEESQRFEELGRLLGDVKACARRGAKDVAALLADIARCAEALSRALTRHMAREEAEVLPLLCRVLCFPEQRRMIWRILRAMPLRLLERVMPWVAGKMRADDVAEWLANLAASSPQEDAPLVKLISQWARRGCGPGAAAASAEAQGAAPSGRRLRGSDDPSLFSNQTCGPASFVTAASLPSPRALKDASDVQLSAAVAAAAAAGQLAPLPRPAAAAATAAAAAAVALAAGTGAAAGEGRGEDSTSAFAALQPPLKRIRTEGSPPAASAAATGLQHTAQQRDVAAAAAAAAAETPRGGLPPSPHGTLGATGPHYSPIDHIFQFHKALKRELKELESAAAAFQASVDNRDTASTPQAIQELDARFSFLRGVYRAHSKAEDEIVFPALESKEALHNVSHAYSLDHQKEEALFDDLGAVMAAVRHLSDPAELAPYASQLSRMCAAVRASLETHVRAEERQLWPLFAEHFSAEEQEALIGQIIGQTGAEVLHSMLSWVRGAMSVEEQEAMLDTMKAASRSTAFEQWLDVAMGREGGSSGDAAAAGDAAATAAVAAGGGGSPQGPAAGAAQAPAPAPAQTHQEEVAATLAEVAQYLAKQGMAGAAGGAPPTDPAGIAADSSRFRPGWEDIFRMNQKQLEAAVRRVSTDPSLEPQRKAYLIQNIMASRYIVAQQRRMSSSAGTPAATPTAAAAGAGAAAAAAGARPRSAAGTTGAAGAGAASAGAAAPAPAPPPSGGCTAAVPAAPAPAPAPTRAVRCYHDAAAGVLGCRHYKRRCQLVAPCCGRPFVCRLCHDEASDHAVDRYAVAEMVCMECGARQGVAGSCSQCGTQMARYYCNICHLFDDEPGRDIYHCPFCNFCRQGKGLGLDSFHCMSCNACMSLELFRKHRCKEQSLKGNCPVCSDRLFESKYPVKELPCGHFMHSHCFAAYTRYSYTCPICFKSLGDMSVYWQMIDSLVASERLPPEYAAKSQAVLCNDCGATSNAPFHFVYHKCASCASYNTRVL